MTIQPSSDIRFFRDPEGHLKSSASQGSQAAMIGLWLRSDVPGGESLIKLLDGIERVRAATAAAPFEFDGNAWNTAFTAEQARFENLFTDHLEGTVPLDTVLSILRSYWDALGAAEIQAGRRHFVKYERREPVLPW